MMARRSLRLSLALSLLALLSLASAGCSVGEPMDPDAPLMLRDVPRADAPTPPDDAGPPPTCEPDLHIGASCESDLDCDDACFCNGREVCSGGTCVAGSDPCSAATCATSACTETDHCTAVGDDALCDDGDPCNGAERCDTEDGCRAGAPPSCNDSDVCTIDSCMAGVGCVYEPFDGDGDGEPSRTCGGNDCDDRDPAIAPGASEVCDNGRDDNCDGVIDIAAPECALDNDTCATAEVLSPADLATTRYRRSTVGFASDVTMTCTPSATDTRRNAPDAMFRFTLTETRDVILGVEGLAYNAGIILREASECASGDDLQCQVTSSSSAPPTLIYRSLPAGDYAIIVKTRTEGTFTLAVTLGPATQNRDFCAPDVIDVSAGGTFSGAIDNDDYVFSCHSTTSSTYDDAAHQFVVPPGEFRDLHATVTVRSPTGTTTGYLQLTSDCDDADATTSACDSGSSTVPAEIDAPGLGPGTYYLLVEGAYTTAGSGSYVLNVELTPSTGRAEGDACDAGVPVALTEGVASSVDLATLAATPDEDPFCGANRPGYRDAFFTFDLTEERDVVIETTSTARHWLGVSSTCGVVDAVLDCAGSSSGAVNRRFVRVGAGTHYVSISTLAAEGELSVTMTTLPATPRPANDLCAGALPIADGTPADLDFLVYEDDEVVGCSAASDLDAYYTFTLATPRFVSLRAEGATSMALISGACGTAPTGCVSGSLPQIGEVLPAGTYVVLVESQPLLAGPARLRFTTSDP